MHGSGRHPSKACTARSRTFRVELDCRRSPHARVLWRKAVLASRLAKIARSGDRRRLYALKADLVGRVLAIDTDGMRMTDWSSAGGSTIAGLQYRNEGRLHLPVAGLSKTSRARLALCASATASGWTSNKLRRRQCATAMNRTP